MSLRTQGPTYMTVWCEEKPGPPCERPDINSGAAAFNSMLMLMACLVLYGIFICVKAGKIWQPYALLSGVVSLALQITFTVFISEAINQICPWHAGYGKSTAAIVLMAISWPIWVLLNFAMAMLTFGR